MWFEDPDCCEEGCGCEATVVAAADLALGYPGRLQLPGSKAEGELEVESKFERIVQSGCVTRVGMQNCVQVLREKGDDRYVHVRSYSGISP